MLRRLYALLTVCLLLVLGSQCAQAKQYTHEGHHYSFTVPDDWTEQKMSGVVDVVFAGPECTSINVVTEYIPSLRNDELWLLEQAQIGFNYVLDQFSDSVSVQDPRSFRTASDRPAADYIIDYTTFGQTIRIRQVLFASELWKMTYLLTLGALRDEFSSYDSVWNEAVDSFTVKTEKPAMDELLLYIVFGAVIGGIAGSIGFIVIHMRRKKAAPPVQEEGVEKEVTFGKENIEEKPEEPRTGAEKE